MKRASDSLFGGLVTFAAAVVAALIAAGFFGANLQLFDSLAHFRLHLLAVLFLLALVLLAMRAFVAGALSAAVAAATLYAVLPFLPPFGPSGPSPKEDGPPTARYTLLQMNLRWNAADRAQAIRTIGRLSPDVITLEEASPEWAPLLEGLASRYPYRFGCSDDRRLTDALILSRRPFATDTRGICAGNQHFAARTIEFNGARLVVGSQHLRWPWPGSQWRQIDATAEALRMLTLTGVPVLIAGDFNAAPWSAAVARYASLSRTEVVGGIGPTWFFQPFTTWIAPLAGLPIDNVLASRGVHVVDVERQPATSSDHLPVLVTFTLPVPDGAGEPLVTVAAKEGEDAGR